MAYADIQKEISIMQQQILKLLFRQTITTHTNMEIAAGLGWSINRVTPRVYELRKLGYLEQKEKRSCGITGRLAMAWGLI